jgi:conjugative transfer signal peptidase TraF
LNITRNDNNQQSLLMLSVFGWGLVLLLVLSGGAYLKGYRLNTSHSYPAGIYQLTPQMDNFHKGDLVLFCPPDNEVIKTAITRGYLDTGRCKSGSVPIIKRIVALPYDRVTLDKLIYINNRVPSQS